MPVHVEELTQEVTVSRGDLPLSQAQVQRLVHLVLEQINRQEHESKLRRESTSIQPQARRQNGWD
jgi:hypothetical protein